MTPQRVNRLGVNFIQLLGTNNNGAIAFTQNTTNYVALSGTFYANTTDRMEKRLPRDGVLKRMQWRGYCANANETCTVTLRVNGADTSLVAELTGANSNVETISSDDINEVEVSKDDTFCLKVVTSATSGNVTSFWFSLEYHQYFR